MIFSKVITLPMISLTRHEESIKAWLWHTFQYIWYMIFFQTILFRKLSLTIAHCIFFAKKLSKLCFQNIVFLQVEILQKTKVCYLFFLLPLAKRFKVLTAWEFFWFFLEILIPGDRCRTGCHDITLQNMQIVCVRMNRLNK